MREARKAPTQITQFFDWTNQSIGTHVLTADALDTNGQTFLSVPVTIIVGSNLPPVVRITSPANNTVFGAPVNIALLAYASSPDGYVASVEFLAGTNSLGFGKPVPIPIAEPLTPAAQPASTGPFRRPVRPRTETGLAIAGAPAPKGAPHQGRQGKMGLPAEPHSPQASGWTGACPHRE